MSNDTVIDSSEERSNASLDNLSYEGFDIDIMQELARSEGLNSNFIIEVVAAVESKIIYPTVNEKLELLKCLIPSDSMPEEVLIRMSCLLSDFKFSMDVKVEILKWMIAVYPLVDSLCKFRSLYELYLNFLEKELLRPYVCHLLYLITDKSSVTSQRVDYLKKILEKHGCQPCLVFLLLIFYNVSPDSFEEEIRESVEYNFCCLGIYPDLIKRVHPSYVSELPNGCISAFETDTSETASFTTSEREGSCCRIPVNCQYNEILQEFKSLKKSTNVSKILNSKRRRLFLTSDIPVKTKAKTYDFILASLCDEENFKSRDFLLDILEIFHDMQGSMVAVSDFTEMLISSWDGKSNLDIITGMLQYQPICCFQKIIYKLDLIREQLFKADVHTKCELLYCFSKMYENWVLIQHDRFSSIQCDESCLSSDGESLCISHEPKGEIEKLCSYLDIIYHTSLVDTFNPCLLNEILLQYERMSIIHTEMFNVCRVHLPFHPVFGAALFSCSALTLDNLCRLMLRYNTEIKQKQYNGIEGAKQAAKDFKLYSNDIHNLLFDGQNENTYLSKTKVFPRIKELYPNIKDLFRLHRHPALLMKTVLFLNRYPEYKSEKNPVVKRNLLQYLAENGLQNLIKFESLV